MSVKSSGLKLLPTLYEDLSLFRYKIGKERYIIENDNLCTILCNHIYYI